MSTVSNDVTLACKSAHGGGVDELALANHVECGHSFRLVPRHSVRASV